MSFLNKLLRAGRPDRISRFHTELGQRVPWKNWPHFIRAGLSWLRLRSGAGVAARPWLSYRAVNRLAALMPADAQALEIGAGMSTLWLAPRCRKLLSIEADEGWVNRLRVKLAETHLHQVDLQYRWRAAEMTDFSSIEDASLDFVLVDGGPRLEALLSAFPKLSPGGFLYVDNTDNAGISGKCRETLLNHTAQNGGTLEYFPDFAPCMLHATEGILWISPLQ
jgi:hypothetical protein